MPAPRQTWSQRVVGRGSPGRRGRVGLLALATATAVALPVGAALPASAGSSSGTSAGSEVSTTSRLADRRSTVTGDRAYEVGTEDGLYRATGWHIAGEMGGIWSPPIKLLDGIWFGVNGSWLGSGAAPAQRYTSGWGYNRTDFARVGGVQVSRTDVVPDGKRGLLVRLTLTSRTAPSTVHLAMDAHSELMSAYPWGWTTPGQADFNLPDTGSVAGNALLFQENGTPPVANATPHSWAATVGSALTPTGSETGPDYRGAQDPAKICPTTTWTTPCDDGIYGKGTGGQLRYDVPVTPQHPTTVWFAVGGSDAGAADATSTMHALLANPAALLAQKQATRQSVDARSHVSLPGDPLLQQSVAWYKQNLADTVQEAHGLQLRVTNEGKDYPPASGTLAKARFYAAGLPDYPWLFATDGEYTTFAAVAAGQFEPIEAHLRALRDASDVVNQHSGKVAHEIVTTGDVYYGTNSSAGNTDETAKFPSAVATVWRWSGDDAFRDDMYDFAVRNMHYVVDVLDTNHDGWPEGLGNVERNGMGPEKLDNAVYTIRGLRDLQDMALSKGDTATATWAASHAAPLEQKFETDWWYGGDTRSYADSRDGDTNQKTFQRHWIGLTPTEAEIVRPGRPTGPLASVDHGNATLDEREQACYTYELGMWHTGTGPTSAGTNPGPSCDSTVSSVPSERSSFSLNTSIIAVSEGDYGRMARDQLQHYTTGLARIQLDPSVWEEPGASPEIAPGGDFGANIDKPLNERSSVLQAWGAYGVLWPVVHQELGVDPDMGRDAVTVVPQVPDGQTQVSGTDVRLGGGSLDVAAVHQGSVLRTTTTDHGTGAAMTIGALLPQGAGVGSVTLDGHAATYQLVQTARGTEVHVDAGTGGTHTLVVRTS